MVLPSSAVTVTAIGVLAVVVATWCPSVNAALSAGVMLGAAALASVVVAATVTDSEVVTAV